MHLDWSISKYVGLAPWSAALFLIFNLGVLAAFWQWPTRTKATRGLLRTILVALIGVSLCPFELINETVTLLHQILARTMFALMFVYNLSESRGTVRWVFGVYGAWCGLACAFLPKIFWGYNLIWETTYLVGFFVVLVMVRRAVGKRAEEQLAN